jgi:hypothetical protein
LIFLFLGEREEAIQRGKNGGIIGLHILFRENEGSAEFGFRFRKAFSLMQKNSEQAVSLVEEGVCSPALV